MNLANLSGQIAVLAVSLGIAACGGSSGYGGDPSTPPPPPPPSAATGVTVIGPITGFGSVFVNGARYEVGSDTVVAIEGETEVVGDDSGLRLGMKVHIRGSDDGGQRTAERIEFDEDLRGPVANISLDPADPSIGSFEVIDQLVSVDSRTVYDDDIGNNDGLAGIDLRDLQAGMIVEVSAFPTGNGFLATRVDRELDAIGGDPEVGRPDVDGDELEIEGFVENRAGDNSSITVNSVVFNIDSRTILEDGLLLNDELLNMFVEVKADVVGTDYFVVRIKREDNMEDNHRDGQFEIEGVLQFVDTGSTPNTFTVNGITIPVTDASSLVPLVDTRVEIKGTFDAEEVLVLREAHPEVEDNVRTEDNIALVNIGADPSFETRLGLTIAPTGGSRVEDNAGTDDNGDNLTPAEFVNRLQIGDRIEARGFGNDSDSVTWNRVERDETAARNNRFDCELRGPVASIEGTEASFSFQIRGINVRTDNVSDNNFEGENGAAIGRMTFFGNLSTGDIVKAQSLEDAAACANGELIAREVQLELNN